MENPYAVYIALSTFEVKGHYSFDEPIVVQQGSELHLEERSTDEWQFVYNNRCISVPSEIAKVHLKNNSDLYQEQFSHLDSNSLYFGQLNVGDYFILEENGVSTEYYRIGQYVTQEGITYNAVKGEQFWSADEVEDFNHADLAFFTEDYLIEKDHKFRIWEDEVYLDGVHNFMKAKKFKFIEPIKLCDYIVNHPRMLEVIECLFQGKELNADLMAVAKEYKEDMNHKENSMCGFFESENIYLPDLIDAIKEKKGHKFGKSYY